MAAAMEGYLRTNVRTIRGAVELRGRRRAASLHFVSAGVQIFMSAVTGHRLGPWRRSPGLRARAAVSARSARVDAA
jgi:hypothetical protein